MLSRRPLRRPATGSFHIAVRTVFPCHSISRGRPTLTERSLATVHLSGADASKERTPFERAHLPRLARLGVTAQSSSPQVSSCATLGAAGALRGRRQDESAAWTTAP